MSRLLVLAVAIAALVPSASSAAAPSFEEIASGLHEPVYVTSAPGDASTLYVVEQRGTIQLVRDGKIVGTFLDLIITFIGDRLTVQVLRGAWPAIDETAPRENPK